MSRSLLTPALSLEGSLRLLSISVALPRVSCKWRSFTSVWVSSGIGIGLESQFLAHLIHIHIHIHPKRRLA